MTSIGWGGPLVEPTSLINFMMFPDSGSQALSSIDAVTWTPVTLPIAGAWHASAYGKGAFVAVDRNGAAALSSFNGVRVVQRTTGTTGCRAVTSGDGRLFAVGPGQQGASSEDGITWTLRGVDTVAPRTWHDVCHGQGLFLAVSGGFGSVSNVAATSPDGINWTTRILPAAHNWHSAAFGNGMYVAVTLNGGGSTHAASSPDGINWTMRTLPVSAEWSSVRFGNGIFVAVGLNISQCATSTDGITWTARTLPSSGVRRGLAFGQGLFLTPSQNTNQLITSPDGVTWTSITLPESRSWRNIAARV